MFIPMNLHGNCEIILFRAQCCECAFNRITAMASGAVKKVSFLSLLTFCHC